MDEIMKIAGLSLHNLKEAVAASQDALRVFYVARYPGGHDGIR